MDEAIEIRLDADSLAAIKALTAAVNRVADELAKSQQDEIDDTDVVEPARTDAPEVSVWQT
jgi:fumarate hydratase class II